MDPMKLNAILMFCERLQESAAEIHEVFAEPLKEHEDVFPNEAVLEQMPAAFLYPELVQAGQLAPPKTKATDEQVEALAKLNSWNQEMSKSIMEREADIIASLGAMTAIANRLNQLVVSVVESLTGDES